MRAIRFVRHSTLLLELAGVTLLVDPMVAPPGERGRIPNTPNDHRNPLVPLPDVDLDPDAVGPGVTIPADDERIELA